MNENQNKSYRVAVAQFAPKRGDLEVNLQRMKGVVDKVECDLLVLPELTSTGYFFLDRDELRELSEEPETGKFCQWVRALSSSSSSVVVAGFSERSGDNLYNSALIALPNETYHIYRKTHLFYKEHLLFEPGDTGFFVVEWEGARIGTMICYDWRFPESARTLALLGADIIAHPSNLIAEKRLWGPTMQTRAFENKVIAATANRFGMEERNGEELIFSGESQIVDMNGSLLSEAGATENRVLIVSVDPIRTRDKSFNPYNDLFDDRRSEFYLP